MRASALLRAPPVAASLALLAAVALPACIVSIGGDGEESSHLSRHVAHGPHCADIALAQSIEFSGQRAEALARIAALPDLTEHEQLFLVDAATVSDGFSANKADVLVALARNPGLTQVARERMAERVPHADLFSGDVERISKALLGE
jgi:hypothetical protein